jgi:hypothetical protein
VKGVLARPASSIENCAGECAFARQAPYRGLWFSSVPRRRAIEVRRIPGPARPPLVTGWLPAAVRIVGSDVACGRRDVKLSREAVIPIALGRHHVPSS